jgi:hypothetical protein
VALACVGEAIPLHFLVRRWGAVAAALSVTLHVYTVLWLVGDLRALVLRPIRIEGGTLLLRIGLRWEADIPLAAIAAVERSGTEGLRLGVLGSPNLVLRLRERHQCSGLSASARRRGDPGASITLHGPFGIRKTSDVLLLQVDDPEGLARALSGSI